MRLPARAYSLRAPLTAKLNRKGVPAMTRQFLGLFCALSLCLLSPMATSAVLTTYSNVAAYTAASGPQQLFIDFNGNPVGGAIVDGSTFNGGVAFGSPEASNPANVLWNDDAISDAGSTTASNGVGPMDGV